MRRGVVGSIDWKEEQSVVGACFCNRKSVGGSKADKKRIYVDHVCWRGIDVGEAYRKKVTGFAIEKGLDEKVWMELLLEVLYIMIASLCI